MTYLYEKFYTSFYALKHSPDSRHTLSRDKLQRIQKASSVKISSKKHQFGSSNHEDFTSPMNIYVNNITSIHCRICDPNIWWRIILTKLLLFSPDGNGLVSKSAGLWCVFIYAVRHSSLAISSLTKWYAIPCDFFFKADSGRVVLYSTDWLSP